MTENLFFSEFLYEEYIYFSYFFILSLLIKEKARFTEF